MATIMMSVKLGTLGLLKLKVFLNGIYDVKTSVHDVTNKYFTRIKLYCTCGHVTKVW